MSSREEAVAISAFQNWYAALQVYKGSGGPARGTICAALVVLERLKSDCNLDLDAHRSPGGSQIRGASAHAAAKIMARFGESRPLLREGGRTNRGAAGDIERMLRKLRDAKFCKDSAERRTATLEAMQNYLVDRVRELHARKRLAFSFDPTKSAWQIVHQILDDAREAGKEGPVAQYLVGAKLQLRYPETPIANFSYSTSDAQHGRPGDFFVGDTAFHVTVSPMSGVYARCEANVGDGLRIYLIVPDRVLEGTRQNAEAAVPGRIFVDSLEAFVGGNLDEMSAFAKDAVNDQLRKLLDIYNTRVDEADTGKSMMIEIPPALARFTRP